MIYSLADVVAVRVLLDRAEGDERHKRIQHRKLETFLGFCETVKCRRQVLLSYFGEELPAPCDNCDTCHGSVPAAVAISARSTGFSTSPMLG